MGNVSDTKRAVSLHLYSPPFQMCQTFDEKNGHKVKCNVTFHSKYGRKTSYATKVSVYDINFIINTIFDIISVYDIKNSINNTYDIKNSINNKIEISEIC